MKVRQWVEQRLRGRVCDAQSGQQIAALTLVTCVNRLRHVHILFAGGGLCHRLVAQMVAESLFGFVEVVGCRDVGGRFHGAVVEFGAYFHGGFEE